MLNSTQEETRSGVEILPAAADGAVRLKALAADLSSGLDGHLKEIIDAAARRASKSEIDPKHQLGAFAAGSYTPTEFEATLQSLDTSQTGPTVQSHVSAWLLGVPLLKSQDRSRAAGSLRAVLRKSPKSLLMPGKKRMLRAFGWISTIAVAFAVVCGIVGALVPLPGSPSLWDEAGFFSFITLYPVILFWLRRRELKSARELRFLAAHALGRVGEVEALDALSAACLERTLYTPEMALISLRVLLPQLTCDHYGRLDSQVVSNLCSLLSRRAPDYFIYEAAKETYIEELVTALGKIGDARAVGPIVRAATHWSQGKVAAASAHALAAIEERHRRETERATLLRGAGQPAVSEAELLRAASGKAEAKPEQLLRPAD